MKKLSVSIVLHNTDKNQLNEALESCFNASSLIDVFLIDHSPNNKLSSFKKDSRVKYLKSNNSGFGAGHNLAIVKFKLLDNYDYHLVMNPDIKFNSSALSNIIDFMNSNKNVGVLMPRILWADGSNQYARRLLPSPLSIIVKRFFPKLSFNDTYEMRKLEPSIPVEIIALCGCFLFFRSEALKSVGLFDKRYFMYFEDFDLCRRIASKYKTIYYPNTEVTHIGNQEHHRSLNLFFYSIKAAFKYFNKWGFIDKSRKKLNLKTMLLVKNSLKNVN